MPSTLVRISSSINWLTSQCLIILKCLLTVLSNIKQEYDIYTTQKTFDLIRLGRCTYLFILHNKLYT